MFKTPCTLGTLGNTPIFQTFSSHVQVDRYLCAKSKTFSHRFGFLKNGSRNHTIDAFKVHDIILGYRSIG
jgi:hypothetical protein